MDLKANPGCCEEASHLSDQIYIPCNAPATAVVGWKGRNERPIRMCAHCTDHNIRNRGGELVAYLSPSVALSHSDLGDILSTPSDVPDGRGPWQGAPRVPGRRTPAKKRPGKYDGLLNNLPRTFGEDPAFQEKVDAVKQELFKEVQLRTATGLTQEYAGLRAEMEEAKQVVSEINLRLTAVEQMLITQCEAEEVSSVKLTSGQSISTHEEPSLKVVDKDAFRVWCLANGLERSLALPWQTANSLAKERLVAGLPEPDGTELNARTVVRFSKG